MADEAQRSSGMLGWTSSSDGIAALPPLIFGLGIAAVSLIRGGAWNAPRHGGSI